MFSMLNADFLDSNVQYVTMFFFSIEKITMEKHCGCMHLLQPQKAVVDGWLRVFL